MQLPNKAGSIFAVYIKSNTASTAFLGYDKDRKAFVFSIKEVAVDGKANEALVRFLKKRYGIACIITKGHTSRKKLLRVT